MNSAFGWCFCVLLALKLMGILAFDTWILIVFGVLAILF